MKLTKLTLKNFKCFDYKEVDFSDTTVIKGANGSGKSTIMDSYYFLLFGKSSLMSADLDQFKPVRDGEVDKDTIIEVEGVIDGVSFIRGLKTPKKKDGTYNANKQFFEVDGVEVKKKEYEEKVRECYGGDENLFKMLSDPNYVADMHWTDRRSLILGENESLEELSHSLAQAKNSLKKAKADSTDYNAKMEEIAKMISETEGAPADIEEQIAANKSKLDELGEQMLKLQAGDQSKSIEELNTLRKELAQVEDDKRQFHTKEVTKRQDKIYNELMPQLRKAQEIHASINKLQADVKRKQENVKYLALEYKKIQAEEFSPNGACYHCGQTMPDYDEKEELEKFNLEKSRGMDKRIKEAEDIKADIKAIQGIIVEKEEELSHLSIRDQATFDIARKEVEDAPHKKDTKSDKRIKELTAQIEMLENVETTEADTTELSKEISTLRERAEELQGAKANQTTLDTLNTRLNELRTAKKDNGSVVTTAEKKVMEVEGEIQETIKALESKVNKEFDLVSWKLFDTQANGDIAPCCTPMVDGIEYNSLNRALKLNVGLSIIETISEREGVNVPVHIDNAECATDIINTTSQSIRFYVDGTTNLTVEN